MEVATTTSKPNEFMGYYYYKNALYNRADDIHITTTDNSGRYFGHENVPGLSTETFQPSVPDDFRNRFAM